jgi:hypothetical protein
MWLANAKAKLQRIKMRVAAKWQQFSRELCQLQRSLACIGDEARPSALAVAPPLVRRNHPGWQRRRGDIGLLKPIPLGKQFGRKTLTLTEPLDLNRNGVQRKLDALEARVPTKRVRLHLWLGTREPFAPAIDRGPKGDCSSERATNCDSSLPIDHPSALRELRVSLRGPSGNVSSSLYAG